MSKIEKIVCEKESNEHGSYSEPGPVEAWCGNVHETHFGDACLKTFIGYAGTSR